MPKIPDYKHGMPYKFKNIKIFASAEWMANSKRKYRTVFDKSEINYLRFEFSFYNKLFDEQDWEAVMTIEVLDKKGTEMCKLAKSMKVSKNQNIIYYNRSWGVDEFGGYWEADEYIINTYIDDKLIGSNHFFIHDFGKVTETYNPYFDVVDLKLFEGPFDLPEERKFLKIFGKETRYVWVELRLKSKVPKGTQIEYFVNYLDDAGQLKASVREATKIDSAKRQQVTYHTGWGNKDGGTWYDNKYFVNIVFMDTLIASTSFEMRENPVEGKNELIEGAFKSPIQKEVETVEEKKQSIEDVMAELSSLIGLQTIKKQINDHIKYLDFLRLRKEKGFKEAERISLHSVFTGNPGTGKTTVVRYLGQIYQHMNLLSKGHVHEVDRSDLVGEFIGQTAPKTKKAIEKARGGILFIDEAYALFRTKDEEKDFGREVIEIIIKEMSDGPGDIAIMVAGYPKEMEIFIDSNPGLKSRFKYYFNFPDYTPDELTEISEFAADKVSVTLNEDAKIIVRKILVEAYRNRDKSFGNARFAHSLIGQAKMNMGLRIIENPNYKKLSKKEISTVTKADVEPMLVKRSSSKIEIDMDNQLLKEGIDDLNKLIGLENVKTQVSELIKLVKYYREIGKDVINSFSMHAVFTGNPGTGKTTIARILGKIYKALGLLEKGHVVETGREGLIAGYIGQTGIKTKKMIDQALGGVLFIDEAYGLTEDGKNSFGGEAIEVILKNMEDKRGQFAVIAAGYPDNMDRFMKANPGLMSRFDQVVHFRDYNNEELEQIAEFMLLDRELVFDDKAKEHVLNYLKKLVSVKDKYFGNAREVRKIIDDIVRRQNLRMADTEHSLRTYDNIRTVTFDDVKHLTFDKPKGKSFGFGA